MFKVYSKAWKDLSDEQKEIYKEMGKEDSLRYLREKAEFLNFKMFFDDEGNPVKVKKAEKTRNQKSKPKKKPLKKKPS
jgi:hypothetical protein